jgi:hypothetical protein
MTYKAHPWKQIHINGINGIDNRRRYIEVDNTENSFLRK